jgi:hypothetical protein
VRTSDIVLSGTADAKVAQLAERTSLLLASVQRKADCERQELERQLDRVGSRTDVRLDALESQMTEVMERGSGRDRHDMEAGTADAGRVLQEARALVGGAVAEIQAQWRSFRSELREEQHEHTRRLDDALEQRVDSSATTSARLREVEAQLERALSQGSEQPSWFEQLEELVASLERRLEEQRALIDVRLQQVRADTDGLRLRSDGLQGRHDDLLSSVEQRVEQCVARCVEHELAHALERLAAGASMERLHHLEEPPANAVSSAEASRTAKSLQDLGRRSDDLESRFAAIRVRVEAHDSRFASVGERVEVVCQQAVESSRQAAVQQRDEILSEADCQMKILRQRVDALSELCDELSLREVSRAPPSHKPQRASPSLRGETRGNGAVLDRISETYLSDQKL